MEYSLLKRTIGKDGKPYYYESLSAVKDVKDVHWYRTDEPFYKYKVDTFLPTAIEVKRDNKGEVEYMVYVSNKAILYKHKIKKLRKESVPLTPQQAKNYNRAKTFAYISFGILALVLLLVSIL